MSGNDAPVVGTAVASADGRYALWDATNVVKDWITTSASNSGFNIIANEGSVYLAFVSKESANTNDPRNS